MAYYSLLRSALICWIFRGRNLHKGKLHQSQTEVQSCYTTELRNPLKYIYIEIYHYTFDLGTKAKKRRYDFLIFSEFPRQFGT